ncbi:MAG: ImmA/IrrE family metallo-endopeptidase [Scardovia wiggsiae]|uniref:ImmA/IrrE family metallo-endopeptidase n=1 Tax=Scardovia wiggsiae TaxID=230143 RepID=UPI00360FD931
MSTRLSDLYNTADHMGIQVREKHIADDLNALYDDRKHIIYLSVGLNDRQKRCALAHELIHAKYHDTGRDPKSEWRARKETALWLIDPLDYITVENMYEGNLFAMAVQLDVTLQVLKDYQDTISTPGSMYAAASC